MAHNHGQYHLATVSVPPSQQHSTSNQSSSMFTGQHQQFVIPETLVDGTSGGQGHHHQHHGTQQTHQQPVANDMYSARQPSVAVETISLEQCCICSTFFEALARPVPQPDLNRIFSKALDVTPEVSFYREYVSLCVNCTNLLRKFDRLRVELEFVKTQVVTYVMESLTQIRVEGGTQLESLKHQILERWTNGSAGKRKGKEGYYSAGGNNSDLSWATHNNLMKNSTAVAVNINAGNSTTVGSGAIDNSPAAPDYASDHGGDDFLHDNDDNSNTVPESTMEEDGVKSVNFNDNEAHDISTTRPEKSSKPKRIRKKKQIKKSTRAELDVEPHVCSTCGRIFNKGIALKHHAQACVSDDLGMEKKCTICSETQNDPFLFETWGDFKAHVDTYHSLVKIDTCKFCRIKFLPNGMKQHSCTQPYGTQVDKEAIFQCDRCDKAYNSRSNLVDHVRRLHKDEQHKCDTCGRVYGSPMLLRFHMERHSRVVSKFKCDICGVCLASSYSLREHIKRHNGIQPYECKQCGRKFSSPTVLKTHAMVHSNKRPHVCHICGTGFKLKSTLARHVGRHQIPETVHTKKCPLCPKSMFRKMWILKKHMENEHPGTAELEQILDKYKDVNDAPKVLDMKRSLMGKGRAYSAGIYKGREKYSDDDESDLEEDVDEMSVGENSEEEREMKAEVVSEEGDTSDSGSEISPIQPSRQSARLKGKVKTKKVVLLLTKESAKPSSAGKGGTK